MLYVMPVPALVIACAVALYVGLRYRLELTPFIASLGLFVLSFIGLCISFFPHIVPSSVTIYEAAAPDNSLSFLLAGASVLLPVILVYTAYSYRVFRGKVGASSAYH
jgi:cytochrome d ubiquinol oxidase subunit II